MLSAMAALHKSGQLVSSLYALSILRLIIINSVTCVSYGGKTMLSHSKLNILHNKNQYISVHSRSSVPCSEKAQFK